MSDILIFITATIRPGSTPFVARNNPDQRRQDYLDGLRSWLEADAETDILFCENSGADLTDFRQLASKYSRNGFFCLLSFSGNAGAERFGKGHGELEILKYAFEQMPELSGYRYILKVSGRYRYRHIARLLRSVSASSADILCDMIVNLIAAETATVAFKPDIASKYLIPYQGELDDRQGVFIEHLMARCVHRALLDGRSWSPFPCTPVREGYSGTTNFPEKRNLWIRFQQEIRRKAARWLYSK
jgi:hypothetical protein